MFSRVLIQVLQVSMESQHSRLCLSDDDINVDRSAKHLLAASGSSYLGAKSMIMGLLLRAGIVCAVEVLKILKSFCERRRTCKREKRDHQSSSLIRGSTPRAIHNNSSQISGSTALSSSRVVVIRSIKVGTSILKSRSFNGFSSRKKFVSRRRGSFPTTSLSTLKEENEDFS